METPHRETVIRSLVGAILLSTCVSSAWAGEVQKSQGSLRPEVLVAQASAPAAATGQELGGTRELPPGGASIEDIMLQKGTITMDDWIQIKAEQEYKSADQAKRIDAIDEWKTKTELLPILRDKVNFGLNALQFLYAHTDAKVAEGKSQDNLSIRRAEMLFWGKISENIPRWHMLMEFQSITNSQVTPTGNSSTAAGAPTYSTSFREAYIDFRPVVAWAPILNTIRMGSFRMPFGIFTETSGGLRDIISSPYLTQVGAGTSQNKNGTGGTMDFVQERDLFIDARGKIANRLEYVGGIMNNNNYLSQGSGSNGPKAGYGRLRFFATDVSFISFTMIAGESNNANTQISGRGKGNMDRYSVDARYTSKLLPGFMAQGEYWQGHDGANATVVGTPANGACQVQTQCGGSGAPGVQRRTWYVLSKYLISDGLFRNFEPTIMYERFDPNTGISNDVYQRTILGLTYYFENFPPKVQSKLQFNYEFRHHQGFGPGVAYNPATDPFAQNAFLIQFQVRFM